jgi:cation/acetate symporter
VAVFARTNLIETVSNTKYDELPQWFGNWEKTGLLKFEDKNADGVVQYVADKEINELTIDNDIMVLANPEIANLPNWVVALVGAGALAAALSTAAGLLLVIASSISHDLIKKIINPNISEKGELIAARLSAAVAVLIAGYFGINPPGFVAAVVALAFGLAAASFFPAILLGIFDKRMNKEGAITGMVLGLTLMLYYMLKFKFGIFDGGKEAVAGLAAEWWLDFGKGGISPEGFGTVAMAVNFIASMVVSRLTPAPPKDVQEIVEHIRIPSGVEAAQGAH